MARLMTMPAESSEVELELDEIATALEADRAIGQGSYLGMVSVPYYECELTGSQTASGIPTQRTVSERGLVFVCKRWVLLCYSDILALSIIPLQWQQLTGINFICKYYSLMPFL